MVYFISNTHPTLNPLPVPYPTSLFPVLLFLTPTNHFHQTILTISTPTLHLPKIKDKVKVKEESTKRLFPSPSPIYPPPYTIPRPSAPMIYTALLYLTLPYPYPTIPEPNPILTPHQFHHPFSISTHIPTFSPAPYPILSHHSLH